MLGRDIMGLAQTGTGKTAAFALPLMHRLLATGHSRSPRALVLAPTRELVTQTQLCFQSLGSTAGMRSTCIYGGVSIGQQIQALRRGVDIVVACPGRLLDHLRQRTIDLSMVQVVVLDEGDMMLDMGFLPDVRRILTHLPSSRQNMLFSATMPDAIRTLASEILREPTVLKMNHSRPVETVSHALYPISQSLKTPLLLEVLKQTADSSVLVFTRTKHRAKRLAAQLSREGHRATSLQGNLSHAARQAALAGFRSGKFDVLVATDIAARGIDISTVSHVINYDIPDTADAYTHRIGRTGRAQRRGDAFTFITHEDHGMVREIERVLGSTIQRRKLDEFDYHQAAPPREQSPKRESSPSKRRQPTGQGKSRPGLREGSFKPRRNAGRDADKRRVETRGDRRNGERSAGESDSRSARRESPRDDRSASRYRRNDDPKPRGSHSGNRHAVSDRESRFSSEGNSRVHSGSETRQLKIRRVPRDY
jgi:ATP-dependent RNA helicase RhlE